MTLEVDPTTWWQAYAIKIPLFIPKVISSNFTIGKWQCIAAELILMHRILKYHIGPPVRMEHKWEHMGSSGKYRKQVSHCVWLKSDLQYTHGALAR